jgi:hypothetical protein
MVVQAAAGVMAALVGLVFQAKGLPVEQVHQAPQTMAPAAAAVHQQSAQMEQVQPEVMVERVQHHL